MNERLQLVTPREAARILGVDTLTLANWRTSSKRRQPLRFIKIGNSVRYSLADIEQFINERAVGGGIVAHAAE